MNPEHIAQLVNGVRQGVMASMLRQKAAKEQLPPPPGAQPLPNVPLLATPNGDVGGSAVASGVSGWGSS